MASSNHSSSDRQRIRQKAIKRRQDRENRLSFTLVIIAAAILAIIILSRPIYLFFTLPKEIRSLSSIQDNWIVIDADNTTGVRYHTPASFDIPQGYTQSAFYTYEDQVTQDFYLVADDETADVAILYVYAAPELTAAEAVQRVQDMYGDALNEGDAVTAVGEAFTAEIAGETAQCVYLHYTTAQGDYGTLFCSFDAPHNVSVTALISGAYTDTENVQTQEQLLAEAQRLLTGLTINH